MWRLFTKRAIQLPDGIAIKQSTLHGNGIFAVKAFSAGAVIEIAPVILMDRADKAFLQTTILFNYYFLVSDENYPVALGLGYSSLYNHAYKANATYTISLKNASIQIRAYSAILPREEITLNYNGSPNDTTPIYFPPDESDI